MIIRHATIEDAQIVTAISNTVVTETKFLSRSPQDAPEEVDDIQSYIADCLDSTTDVFLVAEYGGEVVGFGHLDSCGNRIKHRHRSSIALSILKKYCGIGIGSKLMRTLIALAQSAGYEQIELKVIEENTSAIHLYESLGFYATGKEPHAMKFSDGSYGDYLSMIKFLK